MVVEGVAGAAGGAEAVAAVSAFVGIGGIPGSGGSGGISLSEAGGAAIGAGKLADLLRSDDSGSAAFSVAGGLFFVVAASPKDGKGKSGNSGCAKATDPTTDPMRDSKRQSCIARLWRVAIMRFSVFSFFNVSYCLFITEEC
jgi:hypothetical protein